MNRPPTDRVPRWLFATALGGGLVLRFLQYLQRDSLWGDEAMLAGSIVARSYRALVPPLDYGQLAPVPFLWLERALVALGGPNELALRAVPLLASCALLVLLAPFARQLLTELETFVALGLAATSTTLLRYSVELKPYALDALLSMLLVWAALRAWREPERRGAWAILGVTVLMSVLCSTPAIFVCAGVATGLGMAFIRRREYRRVALVAAIAGAGAVVAAVAYAAWYRQAAGDPYMRDFWQAAFLQPGTPELPARILAALEEATQPAADWMQSLGLGWLLVPLSVLGGVEIRRRNGLTPVLLLVLPLGFVLLASVVGAYPTALRLMLFGAPLGLCLVAAGVVGGAAWLHRRAPSIRVHVLALAFLIPSTEIAVRTVVAHPRDEEMRPLVTALAARSHGEPVYVFHRCIPAWSFYTTDWRHPDRRRLRWIATEAGPGGIAHENGASRGPRPPGEGARLIRSSGGRVELLGVASGVRGRHWLGYEPEAPDSGWSANEASRIRAAAAPGIWLVLINASNRAEGDSLLAAVTRAGGERRDSVIVPGGRAVRVTFD